MIGHSHAERGSALTLAIVISVLGSIVVVAMTTMLDWSGERGRARSDRAQNVSVVDRALAAYEYALEHNVTNDYHRFRLDRPAMTKLASAEVSMRLGRAEAVPNRSFGAEFRRHGLERTWMEPAYAFSMKHQLPDGRTSWWQLVNTVPPGEDSSALVAYVRTWIAMGGPASRVVTEPRIARAELRPGRFSDYQMLVDGPVVLGQGSVIDGRVHTNGYPDAYLLDAFTRPNEALVLGNALGVPTCRRGAAFSTAAGAIVGNNGGSVVGSCAAVPRDEGNRRLIDLLRGRAHLQMLKGMCGQIVFCPPGSGPWSINLGSATVNGRGIPAAAQAVYVEGDASVSGTTRRRLTVGVGGRPGDYGAFGSASLSLLGTGMIGAADPTSPSGGTVGFVVEGDIVPRIDRPGNCPRGLNAAVLSTSGALTIPAQYRVPLQPGGTTPTCRSFTLMGSLGSHYAPIMFMAWGGPRAGYLRREVRYDKRLRTNPPPLFPLTGPWQVSSWKDAMPECLTSVNRNRADCG